MILSAFFMSWPSKLQVVVEGARASEKLYSFKGFMLKCGILQGKGETRVIRTLKKAYSDPRTNLDPNGGWSLNEAISICKDIYGILLYCEDFVV